MKLFEDNQTKELKDFENFERLQKLIEDLNNSNSTNEKVQKLSKFLNDDFIKKILYYTYTDFKQFHVTPKNLKKRTDLIDSHFHYNNIFELLDELDKERISGHKAIQQVNAYINDYKSFKDIIYKIFNRDLEIRMSTKLINKAIPNLIPTFEVALANKYDSKQKEKIDFSTQEWYMSRKLDGIRCITIFDENGNVKFYSRKGKEFKTLEKLRKELEKYNLRNIVLDGEVCIIDENGDEDFTSIVKQIKRKNHTVPNPKYLLFDILTLQEFLNKKGEVNLKKRYKYLFEVFSDNNEYIEVVEQELVSDEDHLSKKTQEAIDNGWEGTMLRRNVPYEGKRSNNLLKVKKFFDAEYTVEDVEIGPFRTIVNGKEIIENILSSVFIKHKGYTVRVGSGFSIDQRRYYKEHPEELIGKEITVQYFSESKNDQGELSLRFPTVKAIYTEGKRDI